MSLVKVPNIQECEAPRIANTTAPLVKGGAFLLTALALACAITRKRSANLRNAVLDRVRNDRIWGLSQRNACCLAEGRRPRRFGFGGASEPVGKYKPLLLLKKGGVEE
jgi:hypothetical protein